MSVQGYLSELTQWIGESWNDFWFTARSATVLLWLQRAVAVLVLLWLISFTFELPAMFGADGWVSRDVVRLIATDGDTSRTAFSFSHLFLVESTWLLYLTHALAIAIVGLAAANVRPRVTVPLTLLVVLTYVHRAPMMTTGFETLACMLLLYLAFGTFAPADRESWVANVAARLIHVHLCGIYLLMATSKLGTAIWWNGDAAWYLFTDTQHRLANLDALSRSTYLLNAVTHAWLLFELLFPVLIWIRKLRPLLLSLSIPYAFLFGISTGQVGLAALLLVANIAFTDVQPISTIHREPQAA